MLLDVVDEFIAIQHRAWHTIIYYIWNVIQPRYDIRVGREKKKKKKKKWLEHESVKCILYIFLQFSFISKGIPTPLEIVCRTLEEEEVDGVKMGKLLFVVGLLY